jgi:hypothetical protein
MADKKKKVYLKGARFEEFKKALRPALYMTPHSHQRGHHIATVAERFNVSPTKAWNTLSTMRKTPAPAVDRAVTPVTAHHTTRFSFESDGAKVTIEGPKAKVSAIARSLLDLD